jgi:ABC-2 type transport system permease protein
VTTTAQRVTSVARRPAGLSLRQQARIAHVIAAAEFKLKYSDSALGYAWSLLKPLGLFGMLYLVFGHLFRVNGGVGHYPLYLLLGIVLWTFFSDATMLGMKSLVDRRTLVSKVAFPRLIIPLSMTLTSAITLGVNLCTIVVFIAVNRIEPGVKWLLLPLLLVELVVVAFGASLILAALYVRFRDIGQVWELGLQILFYASPIIYPVTLLPHWFRPVAFLNPFVQIAQDARSIIVPSGASMTAADVYGTSLGELIPVAIALALVLGGYVFFRREEPWFAERT